MELEDKVALVTGSAGQGMGRSIALTLAREGAKVAINYRASEDQAKAIEQSEHGPAWLKRANTSPQDIAESVAFLCSDTGRFITGCVIPFLFHS